MAARATHRRSNAGGAITGLARTVVGWRGTGTWWRLPTEVDIARLKP